MISNLSRNRIILFSFLGTLLVGAVGAFSLASYIAYENSRYANNKMYPNVFIDNIEVGGKTLNETKALFKQKYTPKKDITISIIYKEDQIATLSATDLAIKTNSNEIIDRAYLIGRTPNKAARFNHIVSTILGLQKYTFTTHLVYDNTAVKEYIQNVESGYNRPAKNALFEFEDGRVKSFKPDEKGMKINSEEFRENIKKSVEQLNDKWENKKVILTSSEIKPEVTLAEANNFGIEELIGEGKSDYSKSIPNRIHNITLAAKRFHGVMIPKDSVFSFNSIIGDISAATGYMPAYVIIGGKTVLGDGGGVCQVSTTMFRAALNTGLPIVSRTAHAYRVGYYENDSKPGYDAAIYTPNVDFKFKNDTQGSILIQTEIDEENNLLYFRFYGKKDNRIAEISPVTIWDVTAPPDDVRQDDPTMKKGEVKQVDFQAWGSKVKFSYKVKREDEILFEEEFTSVYRPWAAVYLVGTAD